MRGTHCLRHWSSTQPTVALSSGEAELGGISKGLSQGIGLRSMGADLGIPMKLELRTDATAAMGMSRRLGVGKIRHLDVALLWVQHQVRSGECVLRKVPGTENPGDALTKHLSGPDLRGHLQRMSLELQEGRPETAPQLTTQILESLALDSEQVRRELLLVRQAELEGVDVPVHAVSCCTVASACPVGVGKTLPPQSGTWGSVGGAGAVAPGPEEYLPTVAEVRHENELEDAGEVNAAKEFLFNVQPQPEDHELRHEGHRLQGGVPSPSSNSAVLGSKWWRLSPGRQLPLLVSPWAGKLRRQRATHPKSAACAPSNAPHSELPECVPNRFSIGAH